jgi:hypothetical protein
MVLKRPLSILRWLFTVRLLRSFFIFKIGRVKEPLAEEKYTQSKLAKPVSISSEISTGEAGYKSFPRIRELRIY